MRRPFFLTPWGWGGGRSLRGDTFADRQWLGYRRWTSVGERHPYVPCWWFCLVGKRVRWKLKCVALWPWYMPSPGEMPPRRVFDLAVVACLLLFSFFIFFALSRPVRRFLRLRVVGLGRVPKQCRLRGTAPGDYSTPHLPACLAPKMALAVPPPRHSANAAASTPPSTHGRR